MSIVAGTNPMRQGTSVAIPRCAVRSVNWPTLSANLRGYAWLP
jgi:hypothetical protein